MTDLNSEQLTALGDRLRSLKGELQRLIEAGEGAAATVSLDQSKVGRLSRMDALQQQAMAQEVRVRSQQKLKRVVLALNAIEQGDYGFCEACGEAIALARLLASPESSHCIHCQSKIER